MQTVNRITLFEHDKIWVHRGTQRLTAGQLDALQRFNEENGGGYFSLIHKGLKFENYVGVLQIGDTTIEILPKADKNDDQEFWRDMLISMLQAVGVFDTQAPSSSSLRIKPNSILHLYFELFVEEIEYLIRRGLVKKYRKEEGNKKALKGSIKFTQHLSKNYVHKERFFVRHSVFDKEHVLHRVIYKALLVLDRINTNSALNSRIGALLLDFPQMSDITVSDSLFEKLVFDRKTELYRNAIKISRLILLNYHPDIKKGQSDVLALLFDMNALWEKFVYVSLRKNRETGTEVTPQSQKAFWKPNLGRRSKMKPDIVMNKGKSDCLVLDTKWKNLFGKNPSPDDLRQMYAYMSYYGAQKVALVYPGNETKTISGYYYREQMEKPEISKKECAVISIGVHSDIQVWQKMIYTEIKHWAQNE